MEFSEELKVPVTLIAYAMFHDEVKRLCFAIYHFICTKVYIYTVTNGCRPHLLHNIFGPGIKWKRKKKRKTV